MRRLSLALLLASFLVACADCTPYSETCERDTPRTCSSTGYGFAAGGLPLVTCAAVGGHCVVENGRARCARLHVDAGAADATDAGAP